MDVTLPPLTEAETLGKRISTSNALSLKGALYSKVEFCSEEKNIELFPSHTLATTPLKTASPASPALAT